MYKSKLSGFTFGSSFTRSILDPEHHAVARLLFANEIQPEALLAVDLYAYMPNEQLLPDACVQLVDFDMQAGGGHVLARICNFNCIMLTFTGHLLMVQYQVRSFGWQASLSPA